MKLSFSTRGWMDMQWEEMLDAAREMGFAGVEICNYANDWPAPHSVRSVAEFLSREGGEPVCLFALKTVDK